MKTLKQSQITTLLCALALMPAMAFAAGGLGGVTSILNDVQSMLTGIAIAVVTIAFMVAGYKVVFGGSTIREVVPIVIGGIIIGSASYFSGLIIGK